MSEEKKDLKELNKEQLEKTAGGNSDGRYTIMRCSNTSCCYAEEWVGVFLNEVFDCPRCGEHTFEGVEVRK